jgi:hypothetical protein
LQIYETFKCKASGLRVLNALSFAPVPNWSFNADVNASHCRRLTLALGFHVRSEITSIRRLRSKSLLRFHWSKDLRAAKHLAHKAERFSTLKRRHLGLLPFAWRQISKRAVDHLNRIHAAPTESLIEWNKELRSYSSTSYAAAWLRG